MKQINVNTISQEYKKVIKDLLNISDHVIKKKRKKLSHLRFAKPTLHGWSFFKKKNVPWEMLEEITNAVYSKHPHQKKGTIADMLSEIVNMTEKDLFTLRSVVL